jgi:MFS family permease
MRTGWNVALQVGALVAAALLRLTAPGWLLAILIFTVVGLVLLLVPPALSLVVLRWGRLRRATSAPFLAAAGFLLLAALVLPDQGDGPVGATPVLVLLGVEGSPAWTWTVGSFALAAYLLSVLWLAIAVGITAARRRPRPHGSPADTPYGSSPAR